MQLSCYDVLGIRKCKMGSGGACLIDSANLHVLSTLEPSNMQTSLGEDFGFEYLK